MRDQRRAHSATALPIAADRLDQDRRQQDLDHNPRESPHNQDLMHKGLVSTRPVCRHKDTCLPPVRLVLACLASVSGPCLSGLLHVRYLSEPLCLEPAVCAELVCLSGACLSGARLDSGPCLSGPSLSELCLSRTCLDPVCLDAVHSVRPVRYGVLRCRFCFRVRTVPRCTWTIIWIMMRWICRPSSCLDGTNALPCSASKVR